MESLLFTPEKDVCWVQQQLSEMTVIIVTAGGREIKTGIFEY